MKRIFGLAAALCFLITAPAYSDSLGSAVGGSAGNQSNMAGCLYQTSPATLTNGQQAGLRCDANGNMNVDATQTTTASPTYITGTANPLSTDVHGATRVLQMNPDGTAPDPSLPNIIAGYNATSGSYAAVSVATSATLLFAAAASTHFRKYCNAGAATVFYGYDNSVTTSNGIPLLAGTCAWEDVNVFTGTLYGIVASSTVDVRVIGN